MSPPSIALPEAAPARSRAEIADYALLVLAALGVLWLAVEVRAMRDPDVEFALGIVVGAAFTMGALWVMYTGMEYVFRSTGIAQPRVERGRRSPWRVGLAFALLALAGAGLLAATSPVQGAVAGAALSVSQQTELSYRLGGRVLGILMGLGMGAALLFVAVVIGTSPAVDEAGLPGMVMLAAPGIRTTVQGISYVFER